MSSKNYDFQFEREYKRLCKYVARARLSPQDREDFRQWVCLLWLNGKRRGVDLDYLIVDWYRQQSALVRIRERLKNEPKENKQPDIDAMLDIERAMSTIRPFTARVLYEYYIFGRTDPEIKRIFDKKQVSGYRHEGLKNLRRILSKKGKNVAR